uniref:Glutamate decarboxylase 4a n=2 Tax=Solanum tuberosum TaxID=4113 RepID=M0ZR52_SOLTU
MVLSKTSSESDVYVHSTFASRYVRASLPRFEMPENSIPKEAAYQIINDELMLDGNPRLNLASFVTTWMEPECDKLMMSSINKNYVDMDEYPVTTELQVISSSLLYDGFRILNLLGIKLYNETSVMDCLYTLKLLNSVKFQLTV